MKVNVLSAFLLFCIASFGCSNAKTDSYNELLASLADNYFAPTYAELDASTEQLNASVTAFCAASEENRLQQLQGDWRRTAILWQQLSWMQLGPAGQNNNDKRIHYWPDGNKAVKRGVSKLLSSQQSFSLEQLANTNVGAQGLPALAHLIFQQPANTVSANCKAISLVTHNIQLIAKNMAAQWQKQTGPFYKVFINAQAPFSSPEDALGELLSNLLAYTTIIKDNKLVYPLSLSAPGIPPLAEAPISNASSYFIKANIQALINVLANNDYSTLNDILIVEHPEIAKALEQAVEKLQSDAEKLPNDFTDALAQEPSRQLIKTIIEDISHLQSVVNNQLVPVLELNLGFNALDGD